MTTVRALLSLVLRRDQHEAYSHALAEPGGYLQWSEPDMSSTRATAALSSTSIGAAEKLAALIQKPRPSVEVE